MSTQPDSTPAATAEAPNKGVGCDALLDHAFRILKERGPMKAKKLADTLGLPNARSLSMKLQYQHARVQNNAGKWTLV